MKQCIKCKEVRPLSEFYKHPEMLDGYLNHCKDCVRADRAKHRRKNIEKIREYDRERSKLPYRLALNAVTTKISRQKPGYMAAVL